MKKPDIVVSQVVAAPLATVWESWADFGGIYKFHDDVSKTTILAVAQPRGVGAVRLATESISLAAPISQFSNCPFAAPPQGSLSPNCQMLRFAPMADLFKNFRSGTNKLLTLTLVSML